jgi:hypothetical protein
MKRLAAMILAAWLGVGGVSLAATAPTVTAGQTDAVTVTLGTDQTSTSTTLANTALTFPVAANGQYAFTFTVVYQSPVTTNGISLALTGPASPAAVSYYAPRVLWSSTATDLRAVRWVDFGSPMITDGVPAANTSYTLVIQGGLTTGAASGSVTLQLASETGGTPVTLKESSNLVWQRR